LAKKNRIVNLWGRESENINNLMQLRENKQYLPKFSLPKNIIIFSDFNAALQNAKEVLIAVPSDGLRGILLQMKAFHKDFDIWWASKGFEVSTGLLPHNICEEIFGEDQKMAIISGPSFAIEVAENKPTAVTIASKNKGFSKYLAANISDQSFRAYTSHDITGVEIGGAIKNILAIGAGISDGLNYGDNARIALINRGLVEMQRLGVALGADNNTFLGLAGMGDLVLTCTSNLSRNHRFGLAIAKGKTISEAKLEINQVIEGITATAAMHNLSSKMKIDMPICTIINDILFNNLNPENAAKTLMSRELQSE
jgi:glycerol-3-phosphate dehydrogenase (NAD(P)+)